MRGLQGRTGARVVICSDREGAATQAWCLPQHSIRKLAGGSDLRNEDCGNRKWCGYGPGDKGCLTVGGGFRTGGWGLKEGGAEARVWGILFEKLWDRAALGDFKEST